MKLSRFTAATTHEALRQVKLVLGDEAVILDTQPGPGGVVVTAAIDLDAVAVRSDADLATEVRALSDLVRATVGQGGLRAPVAALERALARQGVDGLLAAALLHAVRAQPTAGSPEDALAQVFALRPLNTTAAAIECFIGPPGDGKTTTVVKLAAGARRAGQRVALVSTDTQRIGAAMELGVYGRVLGIATLHVRSPAELAAALRQWSDYDRILVDTAGVGPGESAAHAELSALVAVLGVEAQRTVVASAGASAIAAARMWDTFAPLAPQCGIVTKRDLAPGGPVVAQLWQAGVPVSHLTTGRRIPDDIESATPARLAESLLAA